MGVEEIVVEVVTGITTGVVSVSTSLVDFVRGMMLVLMKDVVEVRVMGITDVVEPMEMVLEMTGLVVVVTMRLTVVKELVSTMDLVVSVGVVMGIVVYLRLVR